MAIEEQYIPNNVSAESREKSEFTFSLLNTLVKIKEVENVDDIYMNFYNEKLEIYVFLQKENLDSEEIISGILSEWERKELYFPELFIYENSNKMNILPRKTIRIC